jgi:hypothetical protein
MFKDQKLLISAENLDGLRMKNTKTWKFLCQILDTGLCDLSIAVSYNIL